MRIAIIGSGISGLVVAYRLHPRHDITLFEANDYVGGHTNTVTVDVEGRAHRVDTGFIVFNDRTYPEFVSLLNELRVPSRPTPMSFSVRCDRTGLEYNGTSLNGLFAQRRNLLRPRFYRMVRDILRFNRQAPAWLDLCAEEVTVGQFLAEHGYAREFAEHYLLPMGSAIWSCPHEAFANFPMRFVIEFYRHHGLLNLRDRPTWRVIEGGSQTYVDALTRGFRDHIRLGTPVENVQRFADRVELAYRGRGEPFDHVVFACHSDQALALLDQPTALEREVLSAFPYEENIALLHTDPSVLPRVRRAWASWNYHVRRQPTGRATVSYYMNMLQHLDARQAICVSLNAEDLIDPARILRRFVYHHPVYTTQRASAQRRHGDLLGANRTSFCGAYWGNGFHEDGVQSGLAVCRALSSAPVAN